MPKVLTIEEVDKLLNIDCKTNYDYRNKAMLELLYSSGLRISELLNLTLNDIDFTNDIVRVYGKGSKERIVPLGDYAIIALKKYKVYEEFTKDKTSKLIEKLINLHENNCNEILSILKENNNE